MGSTTETRPARAPVARTPKALRALTLPEAGRQWIAAKEEIARQDALLKQAAPVLERHFQRTGRRTYMDRIAYEPTGGSLVLDQPKVIAFLGARLGDFQKRTTRGWALKLLR